MARDRFLWARAMQRVLAEPSTGWLGARMLAWAFAIPLFKRLAPLPVTVRRLSAKWGSGRSDRTRELLIGNIAALIYGGPAGEGRCLERALLLYRFLSANGSEPVLVAGLGREAGKWRGHAWVLVRGEPFFEMESLEAYTPLVTFSAFGDMKKMEKPPGHQEES